MLKIIAGLFCIFLMLYLITLSLPKQLSVEAVYTADIPKWVNKKMRSYCNFVQKDRMIDKAFLKNMKDCAEYYCMNSSSTPGYKPVPDECPYPDNSSNLCDNNMYKEWCEETFSDGVYIYEAYRDVAFSIEYTPEEAETDFWQTPFETHRSRKGDCEDAVFLFSSHLPFEQKNAMIIWGWVIDKSSRVGRAHVWHQLIDKAGQQYIVEGFSRDWSGIIPLEIVEKTELRKPIFTMTHTEVCKLAGLTSKPGSWQKYQSLIDFCMSANFIEYYTQNLNSSQGIDYQQNTYYGFIGYLLDSQSILSKDKEILSHRFQTGYNIYPGRGKEVTNIFKKLYELFIRCNKQKEEFGQYLQDSYRSLVNNTNN